MIASNMRYFKTLFMAAGVAFAVAGCSSDITEKVCNVTVKTERSENGKELPPQTDNKVMVLNANNKTKRLQFNNVVYVDNEFTSSNLLLMGMKERHNNTQYANHDNDDWVKYQINTNVIDAESKTRTLSKVPVYMSTEKVTINGICK